MATIAEIAVWVGAEAVSRVDGNGGEEVGVQLGRVSGVGDADGGCLVFASDGRTLELAMASEAGLILANANLAGSAMGSTEVKDGGTRILWVRDAKLAFAVAAGRMGARSRVGAIHPRATVADEHGIGEGSAVGAGTVIEAGVTMGRDCEILANVTIYAGTRMGDRVVVQSGAVLGSTGFGYVRDAETGEYVRFPQQGDLVIEDDVEIGANTTIDRGALGETRIGRGTKIDNLVHIAHNCRIGRQVVIAAQTGISGSTVVEDGAVIGGQVGIGDHAMIGTGVILGSGSGVLSGKKLRGPGLVFWGIPAQPLRAYLRDLARFRRER